jgi:hypothetical protein
MDRRATRATPTSDSLGSRLAGWSWRAPDPSIGATGGLVTPYVRHTHSRRAMAPIASQRRDQARRCGRAGPSVRGDSNPNPTRHRRRVPRRRSVARKIDRICDSLHAIRPPVAAVSACRQGSAPFPVAARATVDSAGSATETGLAAFADQSPLPYPSSSSRPHRDRPVNRPPTSASVTLSGGVARLRVHWITQSRMPRGPGRAARYRRFWGARGWLRAGDAR